MDHDHSTVLCTDIALKIDQVQFKVSPSKIRSFLLENLFRLHKRKSKTKIGDLKQNKMEKFGSILDFLHNVSFLRFSVCMRMEDDLTEIDSSPPKQRNFNTLEAYLLIPKLSFDILNTVSTKEIELSREVNSDQLLVNVSSYLEGLKFQARTKQNPVDKSMKFRKLDIEEMNSDFTDHDLTVKLPYLIASISFSTTPTYSNFNVSGLPNTSNEAGKRRKSIAMIINLNANNKQDTQHSTRDHSSGLQILAHVQELVCLHNSVHRLESFFHMWHHTLDKGGKETHSDITTSSVNHSLEKDNIFFLDELSIQMGFFFSLSAISSDNMLKHPIYNSSYSQEPHFPDATFELGMNEISLTFSNHVAIGGEYGHISKLSYLGNFQIEEVYFSFDEHEVIDFVRIVKLGVNCTFEKEAPKMLTLIMTLGDVTVMVDVKKIENLGKILHELSSQILQSRADDLTCSLALPVKAHPLNQITPKSSAKKIETHTQAQTEKLKRPKITKSYGLSIKSANFFLLDCQGAMSEIAFTNAQQFGLPSIMSHIQILDVSISSKLPENTFVSELSFHLKLRSFMMSFSTNFLHIFKNIRNRESRDENTHSFTILAKMDYCEITNGFSQRSGTKKSFLTFSFEKVSVHEWAGHFIDINLASVMTFSSFLEKHESELEAFILSFGACVTVSLGEKQGKNFFINIQPTEVLWSPVLHLSLIVSIELVSCSLNRILGAFGIHRPNNEERNQTYPIHISITGSNIFVNARLGKCSYVNIKMETLDFKIELNIPELATKKNVELFCGRTQVSINNCQPPFLYFDSLSFKDIFALASKEEVNLYEAQGAEKGHKLKSSDSLESNSSGHPIKKRIHVQLGNATARLSPDLDFGCVLDDVLLTPNILDKSLQTVGLKKNKKKNSTFQLMVIEVSIASLDLVLLEYHRAYFQSSHHQQILQGFTSNSVAPPNFEDCFEIMDNNELFIDLFRLFVHRVNVKVERSTPPSLTQRRLNELDSDPSMGIIYGPQINGGDISLTISNLVCILDPLNLTTPLGVMQTFSWEGLLLLTQLSPENPNLSRGHQFIAPLGCSHKLCSTTAPLSRNCVRNPCNYEVQLYSTNIPTKVYIDGKINSQTLSLSFGPLIQDSIPRLLTTIKRLQPPKRSSSHFHNTPELSWWDNLRFMIHGRINFTFKLVSLRWMLDTIEEEDWSVLLRCYNYDLSYATSRLQFSLKDLSISIPNIPYPMNQREQRRLGTQRVCKGNSCNQVRQPFILIPRINLNLEFDWIVASSLPNTSLKHHSPNMKPESVSLHRNEVNDDKFLQFRSSGVSLKLKANISGSHLFSSWVALRIETLPWITHQYVKPHLEGSYHKRKISDPNAPDSMPNVQNLFVEVTVHETRVAIWNGTLDTSGLCLKLSNANVNYEAIQTNSTTKSKLPNSSLSIDVYSIEGALLDNMNSDVRREQKPSKSATHCRICNEKRPMFFLLERSNDQNSVDETNLYDKVCGSFGSNEVPIDSFPGKGKTTDCNKCKGENDEHESFFILLQKWSGKLSPVDYIVQASSVIFIDLFDSETVPPTVEEKDREDAFNDEKAFSDAKTESKREQSDSYRPTLLNFVKNHERMRPISKENNWNVDVLLEDGSIEKSSVKKSKKSLENKKSYTVLVSGLKLLWTLKIRDVISILIADQLLEALNFMVIQMKENSSILDSTDVLKNESEEKAFGLEFSMSRYQRKVSIDKSELGERKNLMFLLQSNRSLSSKSIESESISKGNASDGDSNHSSVSVPVVDIHLFHSQIQLHSQSNKESIILAMKGVYIEGRRFTTLFLDCKAPGDFFFEHLLKKLEFKYTLDTVKGYSMLTDVDVDAGLQWLDLIPDKGSWISKQNHRFKTSEEINNFRDLLAKTQFSAPRLFRQILDPFNFRAQREFFLPPTDYSENEIMEICAKVSYVEMDEPTTDNLKIWIDELSFIMDAKQFGTTSDLIRNVLLAPLPVKKLSKKVDSPSLNREEDDSSKISTKSYQFVESLNEEMELKKKIFQWRNSKDHKKSRDDLKDVTRRVEKKIEAETQAADQMVRCVTWNLFKAKWKIRGESYLDDVEINLTSFYGRHEFSSVGSVVSIFELEDLSSTNLKPGPNSIDFFDPTTVITTMLGNIRSPCQRCGAIFFPGENEMGSCRFHANAFGAPGVFKENSGTGKMQWSCCDATWEGAQGCRSRPHTGTERAVMVRVEGLPKVFDNITFYKHIEINFYPSSNHTLNIQITKSIADLFMDYFIGSRGNPEDLISWDDRSSLESSTISKRKKSLFLGIPDDSPRTPSPKLNKKTPVCTPSIKDAELMLAETVENNKEIFFIKHWRIGHFNSQISLAGFPLVDIANISISLNSFHKSYKIGDYEYLSKKYIKFLISELIKSITGLKKSSDTMLSHKQQNIKDPKKKQNNIVRENLTESAKRHLLFGHAHK